MVVGCSLASWELGDHTSDLDRRLEGESEGVVGLRLRRGSQRRFCGDEERGTHQISRQNALEVPRSVTQDDERHPTLLPEPVDPSKDPDSLPTLRDRLLDLDLGGSSCWLDEHDLLRVLELEQLRSPLGSTLLLVTLPQLLCTGNLLDVLSVKLLRLLDSGGRRGLPRLGEILGNAVDEGDDRLAVRNERSNDALVGVLGRTVSCGVGSSCFVDAERGGCGSECASASVQVYADKSCSA